MLDEAVEEKEGGEKVRLGMIVRLVQQSPHQSLILTTAVAGHPRKLSSHARGPRAHRWRRQERLDWCTPSRRSWEKLLCCTWFLRVQSKGREQPKQACSVRRFDQSQFYFLPKLRAHTISFSGTITAQPQPYHDTRIERYQMELASQTLASNPSVLWPEYVFTQPLMPPVRMRD